MVECKGRGLVVLRFLFGRAYAVSPIIMASNIVAVMVVIIVCVLVVLSVSVTEINFI